MTSRDTEIERIAAAIHDWPTDDEGHGVPISTLDFPAWLYERGLRSQPARPGSPFIAATNSAI